jgi:hypothetical protein
MNAEQSDKIAANLRKVQDRLVPGAAAEMREAGISESRINALYPLDSVAILQVLLDRLTPAQVLTFEKIMRENTGVGVLSYLNDTLPPDFSEACDMHSLPGGPSFEKRLDELTNRVFDDADEFDEPTKLHDRLRVAVMRAADIAWFAANWALVPGWITFDKLSNIHRLTKALKYALPKVKGSADAAA